MKMNSRERVKIAINHKQPDRLPRGFFADAVFMGKLRGFLGVVNDNEALEALQIDLRHFEDEWECVWYTGDDTMGSVKRARIGG